ncbi:MAG: 1-acyl-sn-glycerol-3-phosphate acyltransferase [Armatimonadetes bacterium]|nr:1-acyl-sn-glycerol-3-phosphate acyltransferase [Armatimonadota bacterium]
MTGPEMPEAVPAHRRWRWKKLDPVPPDRPVCWLYRFAKSVVFPYIIFPLLGGREVFGTENIPQEGGAVIAPNHVSFLDPPLVAACLPRRTYFMAKRELFEPPLFGELIHSLYAFPVERGLGDRGALQRAIELVKAGELVIIFPEGTRSRDGKIGEGQLGPAIVAGRAARPIVPCAILGTERMLPPGTKLPRRARFYISFGQPVWVLPDEQGRLSRQVLQAATDEVMRRIREMHAELKKRRGDLSS